MTELPEWIEQEAWADFLQMRIEAKHVKKNTDVSVKRLIKKLTGWHLSGFDTNVIIEHAIEKQWRGLYLPPGMEPKQQHRRIAESLAPMIKTIGKMPQPRRSGQKHADRIRAQGPEAEKRLKEIMNGV